MSDETKADKNQRDLTRHLEAELEALNTRYDQLFQKYLRQNRRMQEIEILLESNSFVQQARQDSAAQKRKFQEFGYKLLRDVEYVKQIFPLKALVQAKEAEIRRLKQSLDHIPRNHPERKTAEKLVKDNIAERDEYYGIVARAEQAMNQQIQEIREVMGVAEQFGVADIMSAMSGTSISDTSGESASPQTRRAPYRKPIVPSEA